MLQYTILVVIGLVAGTFSGVLGIGGGLIMVPAMVYILKMSQHSAQGTSLAVMLPPITLMSCYVYYREGYLDLWVVTFVCIGFFIGNYFGGKIAVATSAEILRKSFAVFMMIMAINMYFKS